jgi:hypothetical protein
MASFHSVGDGFQLAFRLTAGADSTSRYQWWGNPAQKQSHNPSPIHEAPLNQTTFIHGLSISLGIGIWGRLLRTVEIRDIMESPSGSAGSNSMSAAQGSSLLSRAFSFFGGGSTTGVEQNRHVVLSDLSPISKAGYDHISKMIHDYELTQ